MALLQDWMASWWNFGPQSNCEGILWLATQGTLISSLYIDSRLKVVWVLGVCACWSLEWVFLMRREAQKRKPLVLSSAPEEDDPLATASPPVTSSNTLSGDLLCSVAVITRERARLHLWGFKIVGPETLFTLCQMLVAGEERQAQPIMVYVPFNRSDLYNWKTPNPHFSE